MAMTKKEREAHEKALHEARVLGALRWSAPVSPDVAPPTGAYHSKGWIVYASYGHHRVEPAVSSSVSHGTGTSGKTTTQGCRWLYSTKLLALKAARHEQEKLTAAMLARIDADIAAEMAAVSESAE
jgi:hypothetical protein